MADDATAEVFAVVWRRIDHVERATARAWLFGVARNVVRSHWRAGGRRSRLVARLKGVRRSGPEPPETVVVRRAEDELVLEALQLLSENDREILQLAAWEELTGSEIAAVLGISVPAAQQRLHRAKRRLARRLDPVPEPDRTLGLGRQKHE